MTILTRFSPVLLCALATLLMTSCTPSSDDSSETKETGTGESKTDQMSYALGYSAGSQMAADGIDFNMEKVAEGMKDGMAEKESRLNELQMQVAADEYRTQKVRVLQEQNAELASKTSLEGAKFRDAYAAGEGVEKTESGIYYKVLKEASGKKPTAENTVKVHYVGRFPNGEVFDSSVQRGEPAEFPLNGVIKGWTEILQLMPVGSKWEVVIPPNLAYGDGGRGMPPQATLIFEIELLEIVK